MFYHKVAVALLAAFGLKAHATLLFSNSGTLEGWDSIKEEHLGTVQQVSNEVFSGDSAIKVIQTYDPNYDGRYHAELATKDGYKRGDSRYYAFSFRLQNEWDFTSQSYNLAQFIADFGDTGCDDWMPSTMIWITGNKLHTRVKQGSICDQVTVKFSDLATVSAGTWHRFVMRVTWQTGNKGLLKVWFDDEEVLSEYGIDTTISDDRTFEFRVGLYANSWYDQGYLEGEQGRRQIWYDEIAIGTTFEDVRAGNKAGGYVEYRG
ncbi:hypothetical protein AJ80_04239 [Polytolypa hystricis UAMH7299]|uniref:GH16 domain-containing protein n=1 Tax=Polytolypa hystricis (strain UAMH7299) TaxID=1447883 RepID=A0A2B7YDJ8_POLH7|nr:hypothetical protein AJ80_04239 [Polytolypa hystricis UAMH7299]